MAKKSASKSKRRKKRKKANRKPNSWKKRLIKIGLSLLALCLLILFTLFGAVYIGLFGKLPSEDDLKSINQSNASEVFSSDGVLLGKYFVQNRSSIGFEDIPQVVIDALIATEDSRFFEHEGIDFYSIPRVVIKTVILGDRSGGGGSTISQQLVKNLFGRNDHGALSMPVNKLKENITALKLEELYSKNDIISIYLNTVSFGENVFGIKAAARRYFNKKLQDLSVNEAATLIGMLKANTSYNPRLHPKKSLQRRNIVLALMVKEGSLLPEDFNRLKSQPILLDYQRLSGQFGPAPYLRAHVKPQLEELLEQTDRGDGNPYNLYRDGLKITLAVNSRMQTFAENAVKKQMSILQKRFDDHWRSSSPWAKDKGFLWNEAKKSERYRALKASGKSAAEIKKIFETPVKLNLYSQEGYQVKMMSPLDSIAYHQMILQTGFLALHAKTGHVLAYVGGIDFGHFPYDHVHSQRQVGSTFKPFLYATALEAGIKPCDFIANERIVYSNYDDWSPQNSGGAYGGFYSVKGGLSKSVNTIAAQLMAETGPHEVIKMASKLGLKSDLPELPSIALGSVDLTLFDMIPAYSAFVNNGKKVEPILVLKIESANGEILYEYPKKKPAVVLDYDVAVTMREMLRMVADSGTARSLNTVFKLNTDVGGKTGTTQNNADGWFIGITPNIICGSWVGGQSPLIRFRFTRLGQGAATALPVVGEFIKLSESEAVTRNIIGKRFSQVDSDIELSLMCPIFIENKAEYLIDRLFDQNRRNKRKQFQNQEDELNSPDEKKGWMQRLLNKLKKNKNSSKKS